MKSNSHPLGDKIAGLHRSVLAQEKCALLPAAVHALIMACLARIFTRLEELLRLWQAGMLPIAAPQGAAPLPPRHATASGRLRRRAPTNTPPKNAQADAATIAARQPVPGAEPAFLPSRPAMSVPCPRRRSARDPPTHVRSPWPRSPVRARRATVPITFRYHNKQTTNMPTPPSTGLRRGKRRVTAGGRLR